MFTISLHRSLMAAAIALCFTGIAAQAQTDKQPWQATLTKNANQVGSGKMYLDLPLPPFGRLLTLERIGILIGPTGSSYGKVHFCEVESDRPKLENVDLLENRTRVMLPLPTHLGPGTKTWLILNVPIRIYSESTLNGLRNLFRVVCDVENIGALDTMTVTATGYTTPK